MQSELELWIDKSDNLIHKASFKIKGTDDKKQEIDMEYEQFFINYNEVINIEKPKEVLNLGDFKKQSK